MLKEHVILGVHITDRMHNSQAAQKVFTDFGCNIKTRVGLHDVDEGFCSPNGLLLIEFLGSKGQCEDMKSQLSAIEGIEVKSMVFDHP